MLARSPPRRAIFVSVTTFAVALGVATAAGAVTGDLVELEVLGVVPLESESASLLVLRQKGAKTVLPIFVGRSEGTEIDLRMKRGSAERGRTPDLLQKSIEALGGKVSRVVIDGSQGTLFRAHVSLQQGRTQLDLDARPSDSIALAMASRAPIFATRNVMTDAGLTEQDLARSHGGPAPRPKDGARDAAGQVQSF